MAQPSHRLPSIQELCVSKILSSEIEATFSPENKNFFEGVVDRLWTDLKSNVPQNVVSLAKIMANIEIASAENTSKGDLFRRLATVFRDMFRDAEIDDVIGGNVPVSCVEYARMQETVKKAWEEEALAQIWNYTIEAQIDTVDGIETGEDMRDWITNPGNAHILNEFDELILSDYNIKALPPEIVYFPELKKLDLSKNSISDLEVLKKLTKLVELDLKNNYISDLRPLGELTQLRRLFLEENSISSITPLIPCINLRKLNLENNPLAIENPSINNFLPCLNDERRIVQDGNIRLFLTGKNPNMSNEQIILRFFHIFQNYNCSSQTSNFLKLIALEHHNVPKVCDAFRVLPHEDLFLINQIVCEELGIVDNRKKEDQTLLDPQILFSDMNVFCRAAKKAVLIKFECLSLKSKNMVYSNIYEIAHASEDHWLEQFKSVEREKVDEILWGKCNAFENIFMLADVMDSVDIFSAMESP